MKTFKEYLSEASLDTEIVGYKNVILRGKPLGTSDDAHGKLGEPIGWVKTKAQPLGMSLYKPDSADIAWFKKENESLDGVYRTYTSNSRTSLVKLNLGTGTIAHFNNEKYLHTDKIHWLTAYKYTKLYVDMGKEDAFNIKHKIHI